MIIALQEYKTVASGVNEAKILRSEKAHEKQPRKLNPEESHDGNQLRSQTLAFDPWIPRSMLAVLTFGRHTRALSVQLSHAILFTRVWRMEAVMMIRMRVLLVLALLFASLANADNKKKILLPAYVLRARTACVLIDPDSGTSMTAPLENKAAQEDVEKALMRWGRISPVMDTQTADLVITVRKGSGKMVQPTIGGEPTNDRSVIVQTTDNSVRVGVQKGHPPDAAQTGQLGTQPHPRMEAGPAEDLFAVYEGGVDGPLHRAPAWTYMKKDALKSPNVPAVAEFRKAIEEALKQEKTNP